MEYIGGIAHDTVLIKSELSLIIFGAGKNGNRILEFLELNDCGHKVWYFCDNNHELWEKTVRGIKIISPQEAVGYKEAHFLVSGRYAKEIVEYLSRNNIKKIHLLLV